MAIIELSVPSICMAESKWEGRVCAINTAYDYINITKQTCHYHRKANPIVTVTQSFAI